jgi:DNA-binding LacI/PurR family transcriptional regulator
LRPPSCETFVNAVEANELAGVVLVATDPHDSWEKQLVEQHVPLVGTSPRCACSVSNDVDLGVRQAVERLAQRGRKRIALLDWHHSEKEESLINSVRCGFKETLASLGLPCQPHWISGEVNPVRIGVGWQSFREIWTSSQEKPDALIVADDCLFQDVVSAICQMGIHVPQTLDLITNANAGIELYAPFPFTRMQYDPAATAEALGKMLLEQMAGGQQSTGKSLWLEPQWFESSGMFIKGPQSQQVYEQR